MKQPQLEPGVRVSDEEVASRLANAAATKKENSNSASISRFGTFFLVHFKLHFGIRIFLQNSLEREGPKPD